MTASKETVYITRISYRSGLTHLDHASTTIVADVLAPWRRAHGERAG